MSLRLGRLTAMKTCFALAAALCLPFASTVFAADPPAKKPADQPKAKADAPKKAAAVAVAQPKLTAANVAYGKHERQVLDFWKAESATPTPLLFFIHGGGWQGGDKNRTGGIEKYLAAGVSVVAINYRYIEQATADGVVPPVKGPLHDAARALQFVRSKAAEWNLDKQRIGASGGSAGACSSLWLAFHPDMADAKSSDPIARESTRLWCAAVIGAQTTLDPAQMKDWTPNSKYGGHAFGFKGDAAKQLSQFDEFLAKRDTILPSIPLTPSSPPTTRPSTSSTPRRPRSARIRMTRRTPRTSA